MFFVHRTILFRLFRTKCYSTRPDVKNRSHFLECNEYQHLINQFLQEENSLKKKSIVHDVEEWQNQLKSRKSEDLSALNNNFPYVVGSDISYVKGNEENACVAVVVVKLPELKVVYEDISMVKIKLPYIPGFLAFREAEHTVEKVKKLTDLHPEFSPLVIMLDGNGILHDDEFGLACHVGVVLDMASIGVAKSLYQPEILDFDDYNKKMSIQSLKKGGDSFPILTTSGKIFGMAYKSTCASTKPLIVSPGHKISMETSIELVRLCCQYRVPEPIRQADIRSRQFIRELES